MRLKGLHPVKSLVSIAILLALAIVVACGEGGHVCARAHQHPGGGSSR